MSVAVLRVSWWALWFFFPKVGYTSCMPVHPSFFHHLHPPTIPAPQSRLRYTLGAGGWRYSCSLVLLVTGILEMFFYIPTP